MVPSAALFVVACGVVGAIVASALTARHLKVVRVRGWSMEPTLLAGQYVVVWRRSTSEVREGAVALLLLRPRSLEAPDRSTELEDQPLELQLKRVRKVATGRGVWIEGDNPKSSVDSRFYGWVDPDAVVGHVVWPRTG